MPLIKCKECGKEISSAAPTCPNCGHPRRPKLDVSAKDAINGSIGFLIIGAICIAWLTHRNDDIIAKISPPITVKPSEPEPDPLKADISFDGERFVLTNKDGFNWKNCHLSVNEKIFDFGYSTTVEIIPAHGHHWLSAMEFANSSSERFNPLTHKVDSFALDCETPAGKASWGGKFH
jgi:hypothetical protein